MHPTKERPNDMIDIALSPDIDKRTFGTATLRVYLHIADRVPDGCAFIQADLNDLADELGITRRTLLRHLKKLRDCDLISMSQWAYFQGKLFYYITDLVKQRREVG
jgi:DNA-binding transcriptional ArsR family regulator